MRVMQLLPGGDVNHTQDLAPIVDALNGWRRAIAEVPISALLSIFEDFSGRILADPVARKVEGAAFVSSWLRRKNLEKVLRLNMGERIEALDHFVSLGHGKIAAKPRGLVAMWMAGNVATLPLFSMVSALLAKNVCLIKLATPDPSGMDVFLSVLANSEGEGVKGSDLTGAAAVVWFDYHERDLNEAMSLAADSRVIWGGVEAIQALMALPRQDHCNDLLFGPKYSIGVISRGGMENEEDLNGTIAGFVRDIAAFDQRACSAPQTIFIERSGLRSLRHIGERFACHFNRLPAKSRLDAHTTMRILNARAEWALSEDRDVIASGMEANWTVCMDRDLALKEAVQSRTIFLVEVESWHEVLPLLSPKIQTVGVAFADPVEAEAFAKEATMRGVARCVRPGLMNGFESPWDGKLMVSELVRWVTLKA